MHKNLLKFFGFLGVLFSLMPQSTYAFSIDLTKLNEHEVLLQEQLPAEKNGKTFDAGTIIAAPMPQVCQALQDYAAYPSFMPNTEKAIATKLSDENTQLDVTLALPMGKVKKYRLKMNAKVTAQKCHLSWKLIPWEGLKQEETIADTQGYWELTPASVTNKTIVKYHVFTDPGPVPFGLGWIVDSMSKDSIPKMMEALRKRLH